MCTRVLGKTGEEKEELCGNSGRSLDSFPGSFLSPQYWPPPTAPTTLTPSPPPSRLAPAASCHPLRKAGPGPENAPAAPKRRVSCGSGLTRQHAFQQNQTVTSLHVLTTHLLARVKLVFEVKILLQIEDMITGLFMCNGQETESKERFPG